MAASSWIAVSAEARPSSREGSPPGDADPRPSRARGLRPLLLRALRANEAACQTAGHCAHDAGRRFLRAGRSSPRSPATPEAGPQRQRTARSCATACDDPQLSYRKRVHPDVSDEACASLVRNRRRSNRSPQRRPSRVACRCISMKFSGNSSRKLHRVGAKMGRPSTTIGYRMTCPNFAQIRQEIRPTCCSHCSFARLLWSSHE